jgi:hypothetical protein
MSTESNLDALSEQFTTINDSLSLFKMQLSTLQKLVKTLEKDVRKEIKQNANKKEKTVTKSKRAPSGFAKPTKVTKELCDFMNKPEGSEIARTEVTKALVSYIQSNNLLEQSGNASKQKIILDDKLKNLLGLQSDVSEDITYFTIQRYMNKHFYKGTNKKEEDKELETEFVSL